MTERERKSSEHVKGSSSDKIFTRNANHPDSSEAATQKVQKTVMITQVRDRERRDTFSKL